MFNNIPIIHDYKLLRLVERGCPCVVSFDISPKPHDAQIRNEIIYIQGDITKQDDVDNTCAGADCIFHIAALVGPYFNDEAYIKVNFEGTQNIINSCKKHNIKRLVMSSSPSTRFPYPDPNIEGLIWIVHIKIEYVNVVVILGLSEDQLYVKNKGDFAPVFLQPYAKTKAMGELIVRKACGTKHNDLLTIGELLQ